VFWLDAALNNEAAAYRTRNFTCMRLSWRMTPQSEPAIRSDSPCLFHLPWGYQLLARRALPVRHWQEAPAQTHALHHFNNCILGNVPAPSATLQP